MTSNLSRSGKRRLWEDHLAQWSTSGLSQAEYCRSNKIGLKKSFQYCKRRSKRNGAPLALIEVPLSKPLVIPALSVSPQLCLVVDQRYRVEIAKGFDPEDLERVVRVLGRI